MKSHFLAVIVGITFGFGSLSESRAEPPQTLTELSDQDVPRNVLAEGAARQEEPGTLGLGPPFRLPDDAKPEYIYGIDISHHTFGKGTRKIEWDNLPDRRVAFVYMKATEGSGYVDGTFQSSWKAAETVDPTGKRLTKGAYHFLRANDSPEDQGRTFLKIIREQSDFVAGRDLPPAMDLEWDCKRDERGRPIISNGRCAHDNWTDFSPEQIVERVNRFLAVVEQELRVTPVVYTAAQWWADVKLNQLSEAARDAFLKRNVIWIADYSRKSQREGKPRIPGGLKETIWQFTDNGKLTATCTPEDPKSECTDTNVVRSSNTDFRKAMGLK